MSARFIGAWQLESFRSVTNDGASSDPMGADPLGMIIWDTSGYFSVQLGPRVDPEASRYTAYFGTYEAAEGKRGKLVHHVIAASRPSLMGDNSEQVRNFVFSGEDTVVLSPPARPGEPKLELRWHRVSGSRRLSTRTAEDEK